ncbi:hypothetical protein PHJA_002083500 [Phtheirospermum japonicum]|uniref:Uncharacterized protein n=1 Tax=Phtheirospermum japonicum TaxID=374723 RepID=A0A830CTA3_9LAMI|nr:hypothetical protein PHJA_002083500 [Phtheirospermum japonicum]
MSFKGLDRKGTWYDISKVTPPSAVALRTRPAKIGSRAKSPDENESQWGAKPSMMEIGRTRDLVLLMILMHCWDEEARQWEECRWWMKQCVGSTVDWGGKLAAAITGRVMKCSPISIRRQFILFSFVFSASFGFFMVSPRFDLFSLHEMILLDFPLIATGSAPIFCTNIAKGTWYDSAIGILTREECKPYHNTWREIPLNQRIQVFERLLDWFDIDYTYENGVYLDLNVIWYDIRSLDVLLQ